MTSVKLPDGGVRELAEGASSADLAAAISPGLARMAVAAKVDGNIVDLSRSLSDGASVQLLTKRDPEALEVLRHSAAHMMADAILRVFPKAQLTIGPAVEDGFYYDIYLADREDHARRLPQARRGDAAHRRVRGTVRALRRHVRTRPTSTSSATARSTAGSNKFKQEIVAEIKERGDDLTFYKHGDFIDLCRGPHVPHTGWLKNVKLTKVVGLVLARRRQPRAAAARVRHGLLRQADLKDYLHLLEEAKKRDHRVLGEKLDLFSFHEEAPGFPFFHQKGATLFTVLQDYMRKLLRRRGYTEVKTPLVMSEELWHTSGHYDNYLENMFFTKLKLRDPEQPRDDPRQRRRRAADGGQAHELPGPLPRVQDAPALAQPVPAAHRRDGPGAPARAERRAPRPVPRAGLHAGRRAPLLHARPDRERDLDADRLLPRAVRRVRPGRRAHRAQHASGQEHRHRRDVGEGRGRAQARARGQQAWSTTLNPGDGAFYGPKIDFHIRDVLKRSWQCGTIQVDFSMPERFGLSYVGADGQQHTPVMLHRAGYGSIERFLGIIIENYAGAFPLWLAPVQVVVIPISEKFIGYAREIHTKLLDLGLRAEINVSDDRVGYKIREASLQKLPYVIVVGEKEQENGTVNVRSRDKGELGEMSYRRVRRQPRGVYQMSASTAEDVARFTPVELRAPRGSSHVEIVWEDGKVTSYEHGRPARLLPVGLVAGAPGAAALHSGR